LYVIIICCMLVGLKWFLYFAWGEKIFLHFS
jgi:hypothetical protein